jgi:hypothetical protein
MDCDNNGPSEEFQESYWIDISLEFNQQILDSVMIDLLEKPCSIIALRNDLTELPESFIVYVIARPIFSNVPKRTILLKHVFNTIEKITKVENEGQPTRQNGKKRGHEESPTQITYKKSDNLEPGAFTIHFNVEKFYDEKKNSNYNHYMLNIDNIKLREYFDSK